MSTVIPASPQYVNNIGSGTDVSIVCSTTNGGASFCPTAEAAVVTSNSHAVVTRADGALYDYVSGAYVSIQNTNIGTTTVPKNGQ